MEEARLLDSLQQRLGDLEHKVRAYRHDMVVDFQRYYHDLLRDVPPVVASNVRRSLAQSLPDYPLLSPDLADLQLVFESPDPNLADSRTVAYSGSGQRHYPPPKTVSTAGSGAAEPPGSPHDREKELQGLFTPSYLPLLESSPELPKSCPVARPLPPPAAMLLPDPGIATLGQGAVMDERVEKSESQDSLLATPQSPSRPGHVRQSTDDTTSSALSDRSDSKTPRSALRRSSSTSKPPQSPRRVRFEFMGAEVLPTASPQPADFMTHRISSPDVPDDFVNSDSILGDDEEDQPPPRKISSSEALRALSRTAPEAGTVWTVVNSHPDDIIVEQENLEPISAERIPSPPRFNFLPAAPDPPPTRQAPVPIRTSLGPRLGRLREEPNEDVDNDDSSDEDFLAMAKLKSFSNKKAPNSPSPTKASLSDIPKSLSTAEKQPTQDSAVSGAGLDQPASEGVSAEEEDDMFHFETGGLSAPPKPRLNPLPVDEEEEAEDEDDDIDTSASQQSLYATSPAVSIAKPAVSSPPTTPTTARFQAGSLGSYKGRPVIMPVVRNPELHAQAASLGQFNTFVGGLDGRSGMDEGDLNSFRASFANTGFSGTPRSFTERLMMEEAQENRSHNSGLPQ
ncbi:Fc.00g112550.m01.CDS01 [Cosmosporella sp. VM-42]